MRRLAPVLAAAALAAVACGGTPALAKSVKECRADYEANKDSIKASGQSRKAYIAACRGGPTEASAKAAAPAGAGAVLTKTKAECAAEYRDHIEAIKANGQSKAAFDADCRAGTEKLDHVAAPSASPPPADPMAPKPLMTPAEAAPAKP